MWIDALVVRTAFCVGLNSWLQAQSPSFQYQATPASSVTHTSVTSADLNRDGKPDLVIANYADASVSVFLSRGDGTFDAETRYSVKSTPTSVAAADLNGDGTPDLVVANYGSSQVSVLLGNGDGTFQTAVNYASSAASTGIEPYSVAVEATSMAMAKRTWRLPIMPTQVFPSWPAPRSPSCWETATEPSSRQSSLQPAPARCHWPWRM